MGKQEKSTFQERKLILVISSICSVASLILISTALGTDGWINSGGCVGGNNASCQVDSSLWVSYGLFYGTKQVDAGLSAATYRLQVVCSSGDNACMFSCADTEEKRQNELQLLLKGNYTGQQNCPTVLNQRNYQRLESWEETSSEIFPANFKFMEQGLLIATIVFLCLALLFQIISGFLCILNVITNPIEIWNGPFAIYIANILAIFDVFLTLAIWGGQFGTNLSQNIAIWETLSGKWLQTGTTLGFSFWLVFAAGLLDIASCICVRFRNALRKSGGTNLEEDEPANNGVVLLF